MCSCAMEGSKFVLIDLIWDAEKPFEILLNCDWGHLIGRIISLYDSKFII